MKVNDMEITFPDEHCYAQYSGQMEPQTAYFGVDLEKKAIWATYNGDPGNAVPMYVYYGLVRRYRFPSVATNEWIRGMLIWKCDFHVINFHCLPLPSIFNCQQFFNQIFPQKINYRFVLFHHCFIDFLVMNRIVIVATFLTKFFKIHVSTRQINFSTCKNFFNFWDRSFMTKTF